MSDVPWVSIPNSSKLLFDYQDKVDEANKIQGQIEALKNPEFTSVEGYESDPGMIFIELASYVGDVLSFYADTNLKESFLDHASERSNIFDLARAIGYVPNNVIPAHVTLDVYQIIPAILKLLLN